MEILLPDGIKDDIIFNILLKVPLKSLIRFRCVSNSWSNLITNPNFLRMQYSFQHNNLNFILSNNTHIFSIAYNPSSLPSSYDKPIKFSSQTLDNRFDIIGSCNGLLCIETYFHDFVILNPSTTEFKEIPSRTKFQDEEQFPQESWFSYDPLTDDYLLVRVVRFPSLYDSKVQVYTLGSNSWRTKKFDILSNLILEWYRFCGVFVYGNLYWITEKFVYSFNVSNEKFNKLPLPPEWSGCVLGVIGECPCLSRTMINDTISFLLIKKCGVVESWIELTLEYMPGIGIHRPIPIQFCRGMRTVLIILDGEINSLVYDSDQERLWLLKVPITHKIYPEGTYARSTVSLNSGTYMSTEAFDEGSTLSEDYKTRKLPVEGEKRTLYGG